ncbi:hypothetical protein D5Y58_08010 [Klebsiella pneumoniae]|uniref:hypothetical protein n=1 Tax=Klebsiella pneumoniae TaxID=573 RepID=UPI0018767210|nr:hypothetical protein [Klebsiella pneumoniae]MBE5237188.1 hypothetical protein [Klebsiella pneumoniae]MBE5288359.1 hypothetical protein [Klebsiella pneumoniae]MBJ8211424.1 hypothetical protein [Klebsiella pneumoniae]HCI7550400.1 hypothetical protein [Klebsiella pneumoniae]
MTMIQRMVNSEFKYAIGVEPAVPDGLVGFGFAGNNIGVNLYGDAEFEAVGTIPKVSARISTLGTNKYVKTPLMATPDLTYISVAKCYLPASGDNNLLVGDNLNINSAGTLINSTGILLTTSGVIGVVGVKNLTTSANTNYNASGTLGMPSGKANAAWKCVTQRVAVAGISGGTNSVSLKNMTDNIEVVRSKMDTATLARQTDLTKPINIGSMVDSSTQANDFDHFGVLIYNRALTDAELLSAYNQLKVFGAIESLPF